MKPSSDRFGLIFALFILFLTIADRGLLFAAITLQTSGGRVLTGEVDVQTDDRLLWLRRENEQIVLTVSVPWPAIISAFDDGVSLPLDQLPTLLRGQTTSKPIGFLVQRAVPQPSTDCLGKCPKTKPVRRARGSLQSQVQSIEAEAFLVNLDRDAEPDGIELVIAALNKYGQPVPVQGSLSIDLWGERIHSHGSLVQYESLERWTQPVVPVNFTNGVASYTLRFRSTHPDQDVGLHSDVLVQVRLGVFGQGNFSASVPVQIRKFNPFRDRLQLTRGSRSLPNELTHKVRHQLPTQNRLHQRTWSR